MQCDIDRPGDSFCLLAMRFADLLLVRGA